MGRSAPTLRVAVRRELERLRRVARAERDPRVRRELERLLESGEILLDAFSSGAEPPLDAWEVAVLGVIIGLALRVAELERAAGGRDPGRRES